MANRERLTIAERDTSSVKRSALPSHSISVALCISIPPTQRRTPCNISDISSEALKGEFTDKKLVAHDDA